MLRELCRIRRVIFFQVLLLSSDKVSSVPQHRLLRFYRLHYLKYGNMDDTVTISQENVTLESGSQVAGFWAGDQVTMDQLLHCLLVYSANDAASAIAEHIGGTTDKFVEMMNSFAAELGCTGTHFTNPHGLQDENHYTTPYDIYLMLKEALNYPEFTDITQMSSYTVTYKHSDGSDASTTLTATDHYPGAWRYSADPGNRADRKTLHPYQRRF